MRKLLFIFLIICSATVLTGSISPSWAQDITVELSFDKEYYEYGEPVGATVKVVNFAGGDLYINDGFSEKDYFLSMRVIDPAGRLVLTSKVLEHEEFPDAPPLPFCQRNDGSFTQVTPSEKLLSTWSRELHIDDLRDYYTLKLPGAYSFQVQLSAMTWKPAAGELCIGDINKYSSLGVFQSETNYIRAQGSTQVQIKPEWWKVAWRNEPYSLDYIVALIWPEEGKTVQDYKKAHIQLNNVKAVKVSKKYSPILAKYYLIALFNRKAAVRSLGSVVPGEYYVVVSGMLKSNQFFGGGQKITLIR